ncbi:SNARE sec9 [Taphrina deformans PYCC 5710]|uniref:SNARE sec9 n=1 Tax=Taphrina deformans (strain PYCC 5710 / ATCC 11124 / CBS 356.35 / IMI 108563 / JCM 9778 / NBRC 8474) TaxID=1097556 RepID=R4XAL1_TAPDE|nr:SNARE sec9 [Taphrina deformans PYCC 5710]|eukprot:CCG82828.1 SNARE sec9 [Taphrina deformans PYCC 5710]
MNLGFSFRLCRALTMKKFLKGKSKGNSEDADRNALFGGRSNTTQRRPSSESTASRDTQLPAYQDPYASGQAAGQRPESDTKRAISNNGYASDPYAATAPPASSGRGGIGLGARQPSATSAQRDELFRGAQPDRRLYPGAYDGRNTSETDYGHGSGPDGQQTQEEEDEDVEGIKQEIRFVKQETLGSVRNALRMANEAEESGRSTLTKLGQQSESLASAEKALDLSALANRDAQVKARELKHLNRSMFAVQVNKPWGKNKRLEADEMRVKQQFEDDRYERDLRESNRKESERRTDANLKNHAALMAKQTNRQRMGLAERSKYQFDADEEDDEIEGEIDQDLDQLAAVTGRLKGLAMATNSEVTKQNEQLGRLDSKGANLEEKIYMNTHRLKRIGDM